VVATVDEIPLNGGQTRDLCLTEGKDAMEKAIMYYEKWILKWAIPVIIFPVLAMAVIETLNVIGRKLFIPVPCALEAVESLLVVSVYFGMSFVAMAGGHVNITIATDRLSLSTQKFMDAWANFLGVMVFGFLTCGAWAEFVKALRIMEMRIGVYRFPIWPFRLFFAIGLTMLVIQLAINVIRLTHAALGNPNYADMEKLLEREELRIEEMPV
jgi:TRAP-type C4-dicarboxylate transport system permease small subunit